LDVGHELARSQKHFVQLIVAIVGLSISRSSEAGLAIGSVALECHVHDPEPPDLPWYTEYCVHLNEESLCGIIALSLWSPLLLVWLLYLLLDLIRNPVAALTRY